MRVRCATPNAVELPSGLKVDLVDDLIPGGSYVVYAISLRAEGLMYYVVTSQQDYYPRAKRADLFEIEDGRPSKLWMTNYDWKNNWEKMLMTFPEWAQERAFYDRLTDGKEADVALFRQKKRFMDDEMAIEYIDEVDYIVLKNSIKKNIASIADSMDNLVALTCGLQNRNIEVIAYTTQKATKAELDVVDWLSNELKTDFSPNVYRINSRILSLEENKLQMLDFWAYVKPHQLATHRR